MIRNTKLNSKSVKHVRKIFDLYGKIINFAYENMFILWKQAIKQ